MYQILSQSIRFCRLYIKKTFWCVFSVHSVYYNIYRHKHALQHKLPENMYSMEMYFIMFYHVHQDSITYRTIY